MKILAFITARKNSQRLKKKNRLRLNGVDLVKRTCDFAKKIKFLEKIVITTDDEFFLNSNFGASVIKIKRPQKLSKNRTPTTSAVLHGIDYVEKNFLKFDGVLLLQPTSPFRTLKSIYSGYRIFKKYKGKYSVISVSETKTLFKKNFNIVNKKLNFKKLKRYKKIFQANGNFYFASIIFLKKYNSFFKNNMSIPICQKNKKLYLDIDTKSDYLLAKNFLIK